jgi:hypothetical protein
MHAACTHAAQAFIVTSHQRGAVFERDARAYLPVPVSTSAEFQDFLVQSQTVLGLSEVIYEWLFLFCYSPRTINERTLN